jgi:hypothetical protein
MASCLCRQQTDGLTTVLRTTLSDLWTAIVVTGPALGTILILSVIHAYSQRGMPEINFPPRFSFQIGTRTRKIEPITTIPLDLLVAVTTLSAGLARRSHPHVLIGLGALTYYIAGMLQIVVRIPRESLLYEMELRSMLAARIRNPDQLPEISATFEQNIASLCANLPAWEKRRIEKRVGETPLPRWTAPSATSMAGDDLSESQQKAVQTIFDEIDRTDLRPLARYKKLIEALRRCRAEGFPFPEVERAFIQKLDKLSAAMSPDDMLEAANMLANYAVETANTKESKDSP